MSSNVHKGIIEFPAGPISSINFAEGGGKRMRKAGFWVKLLALAVTIGFFSAGVALADVNGTIRGTVIDSTGASVPDAAVTATNTGTGLSKTINTATDGSFEFLNMSVGTYTITVVKTNFKTYTATGLTLAVNQIYVLSVKLELGQVSEKVVVEAAPIQVEKTSMQLGYTVTGSTIVDMPLNGRNWVTLQQIQPGVMASSDRFGNNYSTNGSQTQQNSYLINGTDANDLPLNTPIVVPSPDAIGEFQLVTNTINPEYGRNSGAILNAVIKSGTNSFHGSGFDFYRDTSMNTRNFFAPKPAIFHQNQFGGTIGGPIWKDHTFGFFSYQGTRFRQPQGGGNVPVFSVAQRAGNFGASAGLSGPSPIPLWSDASGPCPVSGAPCAAGTDYATLFSTGSIPTQDFNTVSVGIMNTFVPLPNVGGNFQFNPITSGKTDQYLYRVDHTFNSRDSIWFYHFIQTSPSVDTLPFTGSSLPGFSELAARHTKQYVAAWNHTFSGTTLNELRAGYTRFNFVAVQPVAPALPSSFGFTGITPQNPAVAGMPVIAVTGLFTLGFSDNGPQPRIDQTYQLTDNFSKIYGRHSLKFGFEGRRFQVSNPFFFVNGGHFGFGGTGNFTTGNPGADFLLGFPDFYEQSSGGFIDAQAWEYYYYAQDQWKIRSNLTLTYGMGYQIDTPLTDRYNNSRAINCFRPFQQSTVFSTAPTGLTVPGDPGCTASGYSTHFNDWGPRIGFAYSPDWGRISGGPGKLSIRGGYGIYYNRSEEEVTLQNLLSPPFNLIDFGFNDIGGTSAFKQPYTDIKCISQTGAAIAGCVPSGGGSVAPSGTIPNKYPFSPPNNSAQLAALGGFNFFEPFSLNVLDPNFRVPYSQNYNLTIQREFPGRMILSVGYVGALGRHLEANRELNPGINPSGCAVDPTCVAFRSIQQLVFPDNFNFNAVNSDGTFVFASIGEQTTDGSSHYNSLQVSLNKATSHGLSFLASYTYSHSLDYGSSFENSGFGGARGTNPFNRAYNFGDSAFDARHRLVLTYTYDIPSMRKLHGMSGIPSRIVDGWRMTGITTFQGGFPVDIYDTNLRSLTCTAFEFYACWDTPNVVGPITLMDPRSGTTIRTSSGGSMTTNHNAFFSDPSFAFESFGTFGNAGRSLFHGPGINNFDFLLAKDTQITEKTKIELRVELFNMWNHAQFLNPTGNINSSNFGRVLSARDPRIMQLAVKFYF
jgi:Carboxypeptidase regulatory-like domain